ncbi:MAG: phosphoribosyl-ATP diphosphatase [Raoultibacter sp.]|jgi:phosphoribosyl-ATP pyrophosphohydrolase
MKKTYAPQDEEAPVSQIGATLESLASTIDARKNASAASYTHSLLTSDEALVLGKVTEEAAEVVEAAGENNDDHLRYEAADLIYHLMVVLARHDISMDELAAELNMRMTDKERPSGGLYLHDEFIQRGK